MFFVFRLIINMVAILIISYLFSKGERDSGGWFPGGSGGCLCPGDR